MKNQIKIKGFLITIENIVGSIRKGVDDNGEPWSTEMKHPYGYIENTIGADGDGVDVFLGADTESEFDVFVINQVRDGTNIFDEHKVMFGFKNIEDARSAYYENYQDGWNGLGSIIAYSLSEFSVWIKNKRKTKNPINKVNMVDESRIKTIQMFGEVVEGKTLEALKKQAGDPDSFDILVVEIASPGGSVSEGLEIMVWLDMLSQGGKQIVTVVVANAYSIASLIMLSADMRLISKHGEVMVHNPMVPQLEYANANELEEYVNELRGLEKMMYDLYQIFTGLEVEQIKSLMDSETYLSPDDSVKNGFADTVVDIKKRSFEMTVNLKTEINMSKTFNVLNRVIAMVNKSDFVNQLYYSQDGGEVEIFQADPATYKIGDRVDAEDGEMILSDGAKLIVKGGVIENIDRSVEEVPTAEVETEEAVPVEGPITEVGDEDTLLEVIEATPEVAPVIEPASAEFNTGPAPVEPTVTPTPGKAKGDMPGKVIEVAETKTTTETIAEVAPEVTPAAEPMAVVEAPAVPAPVSVDIEDLKALFEDRLAKLEAKVVEAEAKAVEADMKATKFEDLATKAIDGIYKNTTSAFVPEAKAVVKSTSELRGSIFSQMKQKAGL